MEQPDAIDPRKADPLHHAGRPTSCSWCSAATSIVWCITKDRKRIPIELGVNPDGNVEVQLPEHSAGKVPALAVVHSGPPGMFDEWVPYMPHHATCKKDLK